MARLLVLTLSHVFMDCALNVVPPLIPFLARDFGWSLAQLGAVAMMASLSTGLFQPLLGTVVDRLGRSRPFPWTLLWVGTFAGLLGWAPSFSFVLVAVFLLGIGGAYFHPLAAVIVPRAADRFAGARATAMSIFSFGGTLGIAIAPLLFTLLADAFGRRGTLWILVPAALMTLLNFVVPTGRIATRSTESGRRAHAANTAHGGSAEGEDREGRVLGDRPAALFWLCVGMSLRLVVYNAVVAFLPLLYVGRGYTETHAGMILTGFLFMGAAGAILGGRLSDVWGRRIVTVYSAFLITPGILGFFLFEGVLSFVSLGLAAVMIYASFSAVVVYAQELLPSKEALAAGLVMGFVWAIAALTVPIVGGIADRTGLETALRWVAWVPIAAGAAMITVPETLPRRRGDAPGQRSVSA